MRKILLTVLALSLIRLLPRGLRQGVTALGLLAALAEYLTLAAAPANTSKAYSTEQRTGALETRVGDLEQGKIPNVQSGSTIGQLQQGIFPNVPGVGQVNMTGTGGPYTLHVGALANFTSGPNTAFLAALQKLNHLSGQPTDGNSGSTWATGERQYINNVVNWLNDIDGDLQAKGFMN